MRVSNLTMKNNLPEVTTKCSRCNNTVTSNIIYYLTHVYECSRCNTHNPHIYTCNTYVVVNNEVINGTVIGNPHIIRNPFVITHVTQMKFLYELLMLDHAVNNTGEPDEHLRHSYVYTIDHEINKLIGNTINPISCRIDNLFTLTKYIANKTKYDGLQDILKGIEEW